MFIYFYAVLIAFCLGSLSLIITRKPNLFPPGPRWLPIIGCYSQVKSLYKKKKFYHLVWSHFQEIYGSVIGLKLGRDQLVVASGYEAVKEVMLSEEFEGRPDGLFFRLRSAGERLGIVFVDGNIMHEQRLFCLRQLRHFGYGKISMYRIVTNEAVEIVKLIESKCELNENSMQVQQLFNISSLNVIWALIAGQRFEFNDKKLLRLLDLVHAGFHSVDMSGGLLNQMPLIRFVAPSLSGYNSIYAIVKQLLDFLEDVIESHRESKTEDFISVYLREIANNKDNKNNTFTEKQLLIILEDFFMAGTETTSSTISFVIYYLIKYPHVQMKIHSELDEIVSVNETPSIEHRDKLTYLEATIMETQRHANPVPVAIPHRALTNTRLMGYEIPKDTFILPSLYSVHMDEKYWYDPHKFKPERFLDEFGKIIQDTHFIPFGIGRRKCIGEILAKTTLFLFLSILLHKYRLEPDDGLPAEILDGVTLIPSPFKVKFINRVINK